MYIVAVHYSYAYPIVRAILQSSIRKYRTALILQHTVCVSLIHSLSVLLCSPESGFVLNKSHIELASRKSSASVDREVRTKVNRRQRNQQPNKREIPRKSHRRSLRLAGRQLPDFRIVRLRVARKQPESSTTKARNAESTSQPPFGNLRVTRQLETRSRLTREETAASI